MPVVNDYTALLSGSYWNGIEVTGTPVIVTYSFPTALPAYDASIDGFTAATDASFQAFTAAEQTQATQALGEWAAVMDERRRLSIEYLEHYGRLAERQHSREPTTEGSEAQ